MPGPIDWHQMPDRRFQLDPAACRHKEEMMAILRRAVDPRATAGVDPKMKAVAVFQSRVATPELRPLPSHLDAEADRIAAPSEPHIGVPPPNAQHRKSRDAAARRERQTLSPPLARLRLQIDFEPKEISRVDQRRRGRWLGGQRSRCENAKGQTGRPALVATRGGQTNRLIKPNSPRSRIGPAARLLDELLDEPTQP